MKRNLSSNAANAPSERQHQTSVDWPWPLEIGQVSREALEERVLFLQDLIGSLPEMLRSIEIEGPETHFAKVWAGFGLAVAAEKADELWFKI